MAATYPYGQSQLAIYYLQKGAMQECRITEEVLPVEITYKI